MEALSLDAFIIPSEDPHMSEYPPDNHARREFITGFTGSAGTAVVTVANGALLWTDGRYFLQAEEQLNDAWTLMRMAQPRVPDIQDWLATTLSAGSGNSAASAATDDDRLLLRREALSDPRVARALASTRPRVCM